MISKNSKRSGRASNKLRVKHPQNDTLVKNIPLFPVKKRAYLTYHESYLTITSGVSAAGTYVFAANGCYDPNITGTGHQPMGFDQAMVFYYHYTVLSAKITIVGHNNSASLTGCMTVSRNGNSTAITDIQQLVESAQIERRWMNVHGGAGSIQQIQMDMDIAKFAGIDDILDDSDYRGSSTANPSDLEYFHVSFWNTLDGTQTTMTFDVTIEFEVMLQEPKKPTTSLTTSVTENKNDSAGNREYVEVHTLPRPITTFSKAVCPCPSHAGK